MDRWYANANDIAVFLNSANPRNWPLDEMRSMMNQHLSLTTNEVLDYFNGNYTASVSDYEAVHLQALDMADMLSMGIIRQFPQLFAPGRIPQDLPIGQREAKVHGDGSRVSQFALNNPQQPTAASVN